MYIFGIAFMPTLGHLTLQIQNTLMIYHYHMLIKHLNFTLYSSKVSNWGFSVNIYPRFTDRDNPSAVSVIRGRIFFKLVTTMP